MPSEFIPLAEENGLINDIGLWVLREACQQAKQWLNAGLPRRRIAVNLSARQLTNQRFVQLRGRVLDETKLEPSLRELEITESQVMREAEGSIARSFGTYVHTRSKATLSRRGIDLEVEEHAAAHAAAAGIVRYSGPIRGLDNGVIIDHGSYVTVLAKLGKLTRTVGATLVAGDTVGRAASSRLYLEVRIKVGAEGTPVDPQTFLRKRSE